MTDLLWAPWRLEYIKSVADGPKDGFLCRLAKDTDKDEDNLVIARSGRCLLALNRFPYVNGHLLVAPYRHVAQLGDTEPAERAEMMELMVYGQSLLEAAMNPQGFNMGFNLGRCAGAGVPGHVHGHVVPRWGGDINFMSVVGGVRIIPQALENAYKMLRAEHQKKRPESL